ncbi:hypothetical protein [Rhodococcoides kyotonense]|uniref:Uncharacterized protein n=1 Tax=Rhodococcoides kyotonense TaxID=398843 RepID=A0A239LYQ4_9NOCA|nr:hypothetical protein [Rhodococcus kyotonensis]SNT35410.1 hypothetical protein SAMN05421642_11511 [Rhodococcus kyotonensis]
MTRVGVRIVGRIAQCIGGLVLGVITVWVLWRVLPFGSAIGVLVGSMIVTLTVAAGIATRFRSGGIAFAISATLLNVMVAIMVV